MIQKKTKIVATIGPATESEQMLTRLAKAGLDVARLNFSHGDFAEHQARVNNVRKVAEKMGRNIAVMQDLSGPKIRIGDFSTERIELKEGQTFTLTTEKITGDQTKAYVNYPSLPKEVKVGGLVLLDDGKKKLQITAIKGNNVVCRVLVGGDTKGRRGVNLPGAYLKIKSITEKDRKDLEFGIKNKVDFVALSFVRRPEDVSELRDLLRKGKSEAKIIAKIETPEAVENIDKIIELTDAVMIARGDLAIEVAAETVPAIQKMIIRKCNEAGKPVITATQMLESMIKMPVPTRAEVSDVANAIHDGTDAIMLSEETTLGQYPVQAVEMMTKVAVEVEKEASAKTVYSKNESGMGVVNAITSSAVDTAHDVGAKLIFALTESGFTARMISRHRPDSMVMSLSPNAKVCNQLALSYGCFPVLIDRFNTLAEAFEVVRKFCLKNKLAQKGDKVVIAAGAPFNKKNVQTNMVVVEVI